MTHRTSHKGHPAPLAILLLLLVPSHALRGGGGGEPLETMSDTCCMPTDEKFHKTVRRPAVAGSFYPSSRQDIISMAGSWLDVDDKEAETDPVPQALIVPHAGYVFSGEVAASAIRRIPRTHGYRKIFLLGPSHHVAFEGASVDTLYSCAQTPLGQVPLDIDTGRELLVRGQGVFLTRADAHVREHCLEVQLPLLQMAMDEVPPIVPIVIGTRNPAVLGRMARILEPYFTPENLFIISSDFSHYPSYGDACSSDLFLAQTIASGGQDDFREALSKIRKRDYEGLDTAACGACAISVLLRIMDMQGRDGFDCEHVMYRNSGDSPYGDKDRVVGYNSFVIKRMAVDKAKDGDSLFTFTLEEKSAMLAAARSAICSSLGIAFDGDDKPVGILREKGYGVFVTLHLGGKLRGCIGRFGSPSTLDSTIREMARSAAFSDPRFPPLTANEAERVEIEISVLSPLRRIDSVKEFKLGRDGIYMIKGNRHGTFLPQVAQETGWNTEEFLGHCARDKAGIGYWGWKDAELYTYRTEIVKESRTR